MLNRVRKTQKFHGSSSGLALLGARRPAGPTARCVTSSCWPRRGPRGISDQAKTKRLCQGATLAVVGVVLGRVEDELVVHPLELLEAIEVQGPGVASPTGVFSRHDHMYLGVWPVAHVIDEYDLAAQIVIVTPTTAIEKNTERLGSGRREGLLALGRRRRGRRYEH